MIFLTNNSVFGKNLKYIRESSGFTPFYMAKLLNITEEELQNLESGQCVNVDDLVVRILRDLLDDETADLIEKQYP